MLKKTGLILALVLSTALSAYTPEYKLENLPTISSSENTAEVLLSKIKVHLQSDKKESTLSEEALQLGVSGYLKLAKAGEIPEDKPLTIIDFSLPSSMKRLWTIDPVSGNILHHTFVSHGRNSGNLMATKFSNTNSSYMSSLGFYRTAETYSGKHGYSLRLDGIEKGVNDNARKRAIVIHGAEYANPEFITKTGRLGRSLGCPALPMAVFKDIIDTIKENSCLFIYAPDRAYHKNSQLLATT
ncbi:murein L,D-transpeptidase catalytic domain family protein [Echinicola sp. CAU 1574]|uniref:Murein L,D-transpeptidase catalytic domain family protein n=1 Tax=Echinicola arenosa TaxID=2774144 RepID=A0ABR9AGE1_9BACT|nr:murein L,D-transpeptidase catalytic domain family protein [Echinicola arenosa]MBD8487826.1 murein L,D-transpeptidase catalytic domain family protein [Echinicola arenosa]